MVDARSEYGQPVERAQKRQPPGKAKSVDLEGVLDRGRDGASSEWLKAAELQVDEAWLRWRIAAGDASSVD